MKPVLALSSCWLSNRHQDGFAMAKEIAALGFEYAELSHGIRITLVPGMEMGCRSALPKQVVVPASGAVQVTIDIDTGIR